MSLPAFGSRELERFTRAFEELFYANDPGTMTSTTPSTPSSWRRAWSPSGVMHTRVQ